MSLNAIAREIMVPIADYPCVRDTASLRDVFATLHASCGPAELFRTVLVLDGKDRLLGRLSLKDILHALLPDYLRNSTKHYEGSSGNIDGLALLWQEDCCEQIRSAQKIAVREHISPVAATIQADEPLSKAIFLFGTTQATMLPVLEGTKIIGVVRLPIVLDEVTAEVLSERAAS